MLAAILLLGSLGSGCAENVQTKPGLAALRVQVKASPKAGVAGSADADTYGVSESAPQSGAYKTVRYDGLDEIAVWVESSSPVAPTDSAPAVVELSAATPNSRRPFVVAASGATISVVNRSARAQRIFSVSEGNAFNLGLIQPGGNASERSTRAGEIELLSDQSDEPVAIIFVAPSTFARSARSGETVTFNDLPPGVAKVACWHPRLPGSESQVELKANQTSTARVTVTVNGLPKIP